MPVYPLAGSEPWWRAMRPGDGQVFRLTPEIVGKVEGVLGYPEQIELNVIQKRGGVTYAR